ncbi:SH3 domain-containing C40 family peptidase [Gorillibacterium timonense]|uniref:SH3 domain-containing C40 family peptidase n=1 Tax=Gorillibacterium timonense TaxID=1689269 RepID=UPI00071CC3D9|nr:SH3 domain-containing C40 family peptidase [Gorillibacterium timonense]
MKKQLLSASVALSLLAGSIALPTIPAAHAATSTASQTGTIINGSPYFHKTPKSGEATMGFVKKGSVVKVVEVTNKYWVKIVYNGTTGWVSSNYIKVSSTTSSSTPTPTPTPAPTQSWEKSADKLIAYAKSLVGKVEYKYSGRNTDNPNKLILDCSSYTQYVFKQALGITMKWGANLQHDAFPHVSKSNLRKGDLVFFSVSTPGKIGHVGIYIGDGKFIHNLNPANDVVISDINSTYWKNHYIDAARVIK